MRINRITNLLIVLLIVFITACQPSAAYIEKAIAQTQSALPTISPIPSPSLTPTLTLFTKSVQIILPDASSLPGLYRVYSEDSAVKQIKQSANLPTNSADIISFISTSNKSLYGSSDGTPTTATYWAMIFQTTKDADGQMERLNTSDSINSIINVILPTALIGQSPSPGLKIDNPQTQCDEVNLYKSYAVIMTNVVAVYANCRIKNVVIIYWSTTVDNFDGHGTHLPDNILSQQTASFLSVITEKIK